MARVKIDWTKVEFDGGEDSVKPENVFSNAAARIQAIVKSKFAVGSVNRVVLTVKDSQFGKAFLKIRDLTADGVDAVLAELKEAGTEVVQTAYNDYMRAKTMGDLERTHGDVTEQINDTVKAMVQYMGLTEAKALKQVLETRLENGLPCPAALLKSAGIEVEDTVSA